MPPLPWTTITAPDPERSYTAFASMLPLTRHRHIPSFLRDADPHRTITRRVPSRMGPSRFETFSVKGADLPLRWPDVRERLE